MLMKETISGCKGHLRLKDSKIQRVHGQILPLTYLEACSIQDLGNFGSEASDIRSLAAPQGFPERPERKEDPKLKVFRQFESADGVRWKYAEGSFESTYFREFPEPFKGCRLLGPSNSMSPIRGIIENSSWGP
uniref:Uncharacterized protein n=1 Tax=Ascaris lumbricoides TaxID=6252 RepID=A0A0M3I5T4_ASCLU